MQVKVTKTFKLRGEIVTPGTILNVPDESLGKLIGKVEQVDTGNTQCNRDSSLLIKWKTKTGRDIYLITSERIRRMAPGGKAAFSLEELERMRGLPDEQIEAIITTKETFPGAIVEQSSLERKEIQR